MYKNRVRNTPHTDRLRKKFHFYNYGFHRSLVEFRTLKLLNYFCNIKKKLNPDKKILLFIKSSLF